MQSPRSGAQDTEPPRRTRNDPPPEEFSNPPGVGGDDCRTQDADHVVEPCDPSGVEDLGMEESKPGSGIAGYESEEVGGG